MKRIIPLCLALIMTVGLLAGCGKQNEPAASDETRLRVVTTIFPEYDWVREILGDKADNAEVTMLLDNGADLHSYQPTADDIVKISECDLFIYVGGESDDWVDDALKNAANKNMKVTTTTMTTKMPMSMTMQKNTTTRRKRSTTSMSGSL